MGGYGSTRWNWHSKKKTVEDSFILKMKVIHPSLIAGQNGTVTWSRNGQITASIGYQVFTDAQQPTAVRLNYNWNGNDMDYIVRLNSTLLPWGKVRYWFICSNSGCGRRVANLYLAPGGPYFACRTCHQLTYKSCQEKGQSDRFLVSMTAAMQDTYPGLTVKDVAALLDGWCTDHMLQILLERRLRYMADLPDPYAEYLTVDEICKQSGLSVEDICRLEAARLLLPDYGGKYRPKLLRWAGKLAFLLNQDWQIDEIKRWANGRFQTQNPKQWPPRRSDWQIRQ